MRFLRTIVRALLLLLLFHVPSADATEDRRGRDEFRAGAALLQQGDLAGAERHLKRAAELAPDVPDVWFALGVVAVHMRRAVLALERFDRAIHLAPSHRRALLERATLKFRLGEHLEAAADYRKLLALPAIPGLISDPALARRAYAEKVRTEGLTLSFDEALRRNLLPVDREAVLARAYGPLAARLAKGPGFKSPVRVNSARYEVIAEGSEGTARLALATLMEAFKSWRRALAPWLPEDSPRRCRVLVFASRNSFVQYLGDITGDRASARLSRAGYVPALGHILLVSDADLDRSIRTIRHEGVHQFLDTALPPLAPWLSEGLADYLSCARDRPGPWFEGAIHPDRTGALEAALANTVPPDLTSLLNSDHAAFMGGQDPQLVRRSKVASRNYALSWAFVHYLMQGDGGSHAGIVRRILQSRRAGQPLKEAHSAGFGDVDPATLLNPFLQHAKENLLGTD